ncbi:thyroid receptor-interacting protein 6-like isoform X2 [Styela clava]
MLKFKVTRSQSRESPITSPTDTLKSPPNFNIPLPKPPPPEEIQEETKPSFPSLDLQLDTEETTPNGVLSKSNGQMAHSISSSTPLATSTTSSDASRSKEDELDFYTKSLIDKMNSPGDKDMYGYCGKCNGIVEGEKTGCEAMDKIFHVDCFRCKTCDKLLHGTQFYVVEKETFCEDCYMSSLEKCTVCSEIITDRILRATGKPYHPACFKCVVCGKCLDGIPFTVDVTNQIHCIEDFHQKFAPRCSVCQQPIMPEAGQEETVRIVALDRSFHVNCYKCEKCGTKLTSEKEGKGCFPLDGHILCRDCNTAMVQELSQNI